jgi:hypothetical protein
VDPWNELGISHLFKNMTEHGDKPNMNFTKEGTDSHCTQAYKYHPSGNGKSLPVTRLGGS